MSPVTAAGPPRIFTVFQRIGLQLSIKAAIEYALYGISLIFKYLFCNFLLT